MINMSPRDRRWNLRNVGTVLLVVVIIIAAYILVSSSPGESVLSPEDVMNDIEKYLELGKLGESITVKGYYYNEGIEGKGFIIYSMTIDPYLPVQRLPINHSNVNISSLPKGVLDEEVRYLFTGVLTLDESSPLDDAVILVAEKVEPV